MIQISDDVSQKLKKILRDGNIPLKTKWQRILDNFFTDKDESSDNSDVVIHNDIENTITGIFEQRASFKKNYNKNDAGG